MSKLSEAQKAMLVSFMESHDNFAKGKVAKVVADKYWKIITERLNNLNGALKTTKQWKKTWSDIKIEAKRKYAILQAELEKTGGGSPSTSVTEGESLQDRVLSIVGTTVLNGISGVQEAGMSFLEDEGTPASCGGGRISFSEADPILSGETATSVRVSSKKAQTERWLTLKQTQSKALEKIADAEERKAVALEDIASSFRRLANYFENYGPAE